MHSTDDVYIRQGYGRSLGFGDRLALLIVDFTRAFADPALFGGGNIQSAIDHTVSLLAAVRSAKLPVAFSRHVYAADGSDHGLFVQKNDRLKLLSAGTPSGEIVPELTPIAGEFVINKRHPSIFFGTDVTGWLTARRVDTVIVAGCTTSGCIRASVVDALGYGFRPIVVRDCVGDRANAPHEANLFDIEQKYGDVISLETALAKISTV